MKFYRYEALQYAVLGADGDFESSKFTNPKIELRTYNLFKETPKGYWIGYGQVGNLRSSGRWVSKTAKKRYAYPTTEEAINNFIKRTERRTEILTGQLDFCKEALRRAKLLTPAQTNK